MVTVAGTDADARSDRSVTTVPPVGAGPEIVTSRVALMPPTTLVGLTTADKRVGAKIVRFAVAELPFNAAEM